MRTGRFFVSGGLALAAGLLNAAEPLMLRVETRTDGTCSFDAALRAVERQRAEDPARAIVIRVPSGLWRADGTLALDARHARAGWGRLTVFGEKGSGLLGSRRIVGWRKGGFNGRSDVWTAEVSEPVLQQTPEILFFGGRRMIRARWPNADPKRPYSGGWAYVDGTPAGMYEKCAGASRSAFTVRAKDARTWRCPDEGIVDIFPQYNWINEERRIAAWDPVTRRLTLGHPLRFEARPGDRYILEGLREELDAPGEWHCDRAAGKVRFIPPKGEDPNAGIVSIPSGGPVLRLTGVANVDVIGLEVAEADEGLRAEDVARIRVVGCRFHGLGGFSGCAVRLARAMRCTVADCDVWDVGAHGISIEGGDPSTLERSGNRVENCYVHHTGRVDRHGIGVLVAGQGATVAHCLVHDMPRAALIIRGRLHTVEYNVIRDVNLELEDTGAIYGGGWVNGAGTAMPRGRARTSSASSRAASISTRRSAASRSTGTSSSARTSPRSTCTTPATSRSRTTSSSPTPARRAGSTRSRSRAGTPRRTATSSRSGRRPSRASGTPSWTSSPRGRTSRRSPIRRTTRSSRTAPSCAATSCATTSSSTPTSRRPSTPACATAT